MSHTIKKLTKNVEHPLEEFFDIEPGSTEITEYQRETELVEGEGYDEKDNEIEEQYQEVYDKALECFEELSDEVEDVEGKFKARLSEVRLQHLTVALNAADKKAKIKEHKDKLKAKEAAAGTPQTVNNTLIVDRESLLDQLQDIDSSSIIDGEVKKVDE